MLIRPVLLDAAVPVQVPSLSRHVVVESARISSRMPWFCRLGRVSRRAFLTLLAPFDSDTEFRRRSAACSIGDETRRLNTVCQRYRGHRQAHVQQARIQCSEAFVMCCCVVVREFHAGKKGSGRFRQMGIGTRIIASCCSCTNNCPILQYGVP